jgi:hypothetical protein
MVKTVIGEVLENATLSVAVGGSSYTTDPDTGNPVPITTDYQIRCYLKSNSKPPKELEQSQPKNTPLTWIDGSITEVINLANPSQKLPPIMPSGTTEAITAVISGIHGTFYPIARVPSASQLLYIDQSIIGQKIWGWFDVTA